MGTENKTIYVYSNWGNRVPELMGMLYVSDIRGKELFSFEYKKDWIHSTGSSFLLDPDLLLFEGRQYVPSGKPLFGVFSDSCPDRWGRLLMNRKEAIMARKEGRKPRTLMESDFLLGVFDESRMGGLRFSLSENGPFLSEDVNFPVPPWTTLRALESASLVFENDENGQEEKWLSQLLAPGSSLGGARPKASVRAPDGSLWIAKFPSKHDEWNSGAWEIIVHDLAGKCGLRIPEARLETFSDIGGTFLVKRFDRSGVGRIHFSSAMTLLSKTDGDGADNVSYLDLAYFIKANGAFPKQDLEELWKRLVFNIAVSNNDDHLRNHGFLLSKNGWTLSPQFDVNPNIYGNTLSLNVTSDNNAASFELALETAEYYGVDMRSAENTLADIKKTVTQNWRVLAADYGLSRGAIDRMEPAFKMEYKL